jgi:hypothetical protein
MVGRCRRCGERLSLIQRLQAQDFCSPEHKLEFQREQESVALARLQQTASNLRKPPEAGRPLPRKEGSSAGSRGTIETKSSPIPPEAGFREDWTPPKPPAPLPPALREVEWVIRWACSAPSIAPAAWSPGVEMIRPPVVEHRGDILTILSPRTVPHPWPSKPAARRAPLQIQGFDWQRAMEFSGNDPGEAGLAPIAGMRARLHEPVVRWCEPAETASEILPSPPRSHSRLEAGFGPAAGLAALARFEPLPPTMRSGGIREMDAGEWEPEFARIVVLVRGGTRSLTAAGLGGLVGPARRESAAVAAKRSLPHFAALPVPMKAQGFDYTPDLGLIAIASDWLAAPVPLPVPESAAGKPARAPPEPNEPALTPSAAAELAIDDSISPSTPPQASSIFWERATLSGARPAPAAGEGHGWFSSEPRIFHRTTAKRPVVPVKRGRIKMEVHLPPPALEPWFEPLTCPFGGDPYGSR